MRAEAAFRAHRQSRIEAEVANNNAERATGLTLEEVAEYFRRGLHEVQACLQYYAEYQDEVDAYMAAKDEESERLRLLWEREQALLAG